jgi:hypothetical protein
MGVCASQVASSVPPGYQERVYLFHGLPMDGTRLHGVYLYHNAPVAVCIHIARSSLHPSSPTEDALVKHLSKTTVTSLEIGSYVRPPCQKDRSCIHGQLFLDGKEYQPS